VTAVGYTSGDPRKVDVAGDTMTGDLVLPADPDQALEAATKQYVDSVGSSGGVPSGTVVTETGFGQASAVGVATTFARGDHTHGTPTAPTATSVGAVETNFVGASPPAAGNDPLWQVQFNDTPLITDINIAEWSYIFGGIKRLAAWLNEVGRYRSEQQAGSLGDHLVTLIASNATAAGRLIRFERRDGSNVRQITGGIDQDGRLETSLYAWQSFGTFGANYTAAVSNSFGGVPYPLAGRVESDDIVRLRGGITVGGSATANGDVMCVVPSDLRPTSPVVLIATAAGAAGAVEVAVNGNVICRRSGTAGASYLSFDGLTYTRTAGTT
jgi:hypothetical protein